MCKEKTIKTKKPTVKQDVLDKMSNFTPSTTDVLIGYIYIRRIHCDKAIENGQDGWVYIGETTNLLDRQYHFRSLSVTYGGKLIEEARKEYGPSNWSWEILDKVEAESADELEKLLKQKEAAYIIQYKSYKNGFNSKWGLSEYLNEKAA